VRPNIYLDDELVAFHDQTLAFVKNEVRPRGEEWEAAHRVPRDILLEMGKIGFFGIRHPERFGGLGLGPLASCAFAEALGTSTFGGFSATVLVHTDMASPHLLHAGNEEQLERFMPGVISGEILTAVAVTEPDAGSDVAAMRTSARKDGDGYRLNGSKIFITNGVHADLVFVAAKTDASAGSRGVTMFAVERGTEGFSVGRALDKHGWLCSDTAELVFEDAWVPEENVLGELNRGFYSIMQNFQNERMVMAALAVGEAQTAIDLTLAHTQNRAAFGATLYDKQAIRQRLAMAQAQVDAGRQFAYHCAWLMEQGVDAVKEVSGLKALVGELVNRVLYDCVQFHGGMGYMRESAIERMSRDARIQSIGGGATEVMLEEVAKRSYV
jgi:acyl-CoA dehydrogenase